MTAPSQQAIRETALGRYHADAEFHARAYSASHLARILSGHRSPRTTEQTKRERDLTIEAAAIALVLADLSADVLLSAEPPASAAAALAHADSTRRVLA